MAKTIKLLLTETVDNLGIVGDVVNVKIGYARNFLLPRGFATTPSDELMAQLAEKRVDAEKQAAELKNVREALIGKMENLEITLQRSCNDLGILYGSVTQHDLSEALSEVGYAIKDREVRLGETIKRVGTYDVHIKLATDLEANVKVWVVADRELDMDDREEMEFDNEGELIEKKAPRRKRAERDAKEVAAEEAVESGAAEAKA